MARVRPEPEALGGGLWSVPVPIPGNPLGYTLVYALESERGLVLIDGGGRRGGDVAARRAAGAGEAELPEYQQPDAPGGRRIDPPAKPDREVSDGELIDLPGRKLRVIWTPGHSPGHICLHLEDAGRMFTGDHVLPRITPHIGLYPYDTPDVDPLGDYLESLSRVADIGAAAAAAALPAHEHRFSDIAARAGEIAEHHEERLSEVAGLLTDEPATLWDIASRMTWNVDWSTMHPVMRRMATGEAAAHLRTLDRRGLLHAHGGSPLTYSR